MREEEKKNGGISDVIRFIFRRSVLIILGFILEILILLPLTYIFVTFGLPKFAIGYAVIGVTIGGIKKTLDAKKKIRELPSVHFGMLLLLCIYDYSLLFIGVLLGLFGLKVMQGLVISSLAYPILDREAVSKKYLTPGLLLPFMCFLLYSLLSKVPLKYSRDLSGGKGQYVIYNVFKNKITKFLSVNLQLTL